MYFEELSFDGATYEIIDARVGDEVFSGAGVDWKGLTRGDRTLFMDELRAAVELFGVSAAPGARRLSAELDGDVCVGYRLTVDEVEQSGDEAARAEIVSRIQRLLELVHGLLLIYD